MSTMLPPVLLKTFVSTSLDDAGGHVAAIQHDTRAVQQLLDNLRSKGESDATADDLRRLLDATVLVSSELLDRVQMCADGIARELKDLGAHVIEVGR